MVSKWRYLHKVLGITLGSLLLLVALSGFLLVFKDDLVALNIDATDSTAAYDADKIASGFEQIMQHHALDDVFYVKTPSQGRQYWWLATTDGSIHLYDGGTSASIEDDWNILPLVHWLAEFHTEMLLSNGGSTALTVLGFGTFILMIAGFISWWPGRRGFKWNHLLLRSSRRGSALRQHRAVAIICLPLLVLSVVTGVGMSVQGAIRFLAPDPEKKVEKLAVPKASTPVIDVSELKSLILKAQMQLPDSQITLIGLPSSSRPDLRLRFRGPSEWHVNGKTNISVNVDTHDVVVKSVEKASAGRKFLNLFYPLHSSYGMPGVYVTVVALTGFMTTYLAGIGIFAWLKRRGGLLS